jgi:hypothetical protein
MGVMSCDAFPFWEDSSGIVDPNTANLLVFVMGVERNVQEADLGFCTIWFKYIKDTNWVSLSSSCYVWCMVYVMCYVWWYDAAYWDT